MPEGREDVAALAARVRGRSPLDRGADYVSEWEGYRITNLEGITEGEGEAPPPGPPTGVLVPSVRAPGSSLTRRVFERFMQRHICDPMAPSLCYSQVRFERERSTSGGATAPATSSPPWIGPRPSSPACADANRYCSGPKAS